MSCIIEGKSIDKFELGWNIERLKSELSSQYFKMELPHCYLIETENFKFWVNKNTNTISQISVFGSYKGMFRDKIHLGSTLKDIEKYIGEWEEVLDVYILPQYQGICFELQDVDNIEEEWNERTTPIEYITVFNKDFYYCTLLNIFLWCGDCYDINMVREKYIKREVLQHIEQEIGYKIDLEKSKLICVKCKHNHLR